MLKNKLEKYFLNIINTLDHMIETILTWNWVWTCKIFKIIGICFHVILKHIAIALEFVLDCIFKFVLVSMILLLFLLFT